MNNPFFGGNFGGDFNMQGTLGGIDFGVLGPIINIDAIILDSIDTIYLIDINTIKLQGD